jgi:hypothetical protein
MAVIHLVLEALNTLKLHNLHKNHARYHIFSSG